LILRSCFWTTSLERILSLLLSTMLTLSLTLLVICPVKKWCSCMWEMRKAPCSVRFGNWKVLKREIVKLTGVSWDYLTIERGAYPCPPSDDANGQGQATFSFDADDKISLYIPKEIFDRIADAIIDLYDNWNDRVFITWTGGLWIQITAWNVRVWNEEFEYSWWTATLTDNATNYVMLDGAWTIAIDTAWRDQKKVKVATIITSGGQIQSLRRRKIDAIGGELGGGGWFKNISNCVYKGRFLVQFIADWQQWNLTYERGRVKTATTWEKTYTVTYKGGKLVWSVES